ncbi:hypothetical protein ON010_g19141 [Phytophthora cinnamomi]|nr:hypothetical protein ON010_g19141 [Phytophthora cinnamomi]
MVKRRKGESVATTAPLSVVTRSRKRSGEARNEATRAGKTAKTRESSTGASASAPAMTRARKPARREKASSVSDLPTRARHTTRKRNTASESPLVADSEEQHGSNESICNDELAPYDQDSFMDTMRAVPMLHPVSDDDINLSAEAIDVGYGSEEQPGSDSDAETGDWRYVDDVDSTDSEEDDESISAFVPDEDLRAIVDSG